MKNDIGKLTRIQAYGYLRDLERPSGISPRQWVGVKVFLYKVARGQPTYYRSQVKIAEEMGVTDRAVRNYVRWAVDAGILTVWENAGVGRPGNPRKTNRYLFTELLVVEEQSSSTVEEQSSSNYSPTLRADEIRKAVQTEGTTFPLSVLRGGSAAAERGDRKEMAEGRKQTASEAIAAANVKGRVKRKPRAKDPDPSRRTANYFADRWYLMTTDAPELAEIRMWDSKTAAIGYVRATFFEPQAGRPYTEAEVRSFIDLFIEDVRTSRILIKDRQSAWMRFVGMWGRGTLAVKEGRYLSEIKRARR